LAETPPPPPSTFGLIDEGAIGQPRWTTSLSDPLILLLHIRVLSVFLEILKILTDPFLTKYKMQEICEV
jgi:hypothetical protein